MPDIQAQLGADIAMALDECLAHPADSTSARRSMERTLGWARRARDRFLTIRDGRACSVIVTNPAQAQFGIIQGSVFPELREESVRATVGIGFEGYAIGGLGVGEPIDLMYAILSSTDYGAGDEVIMSIAGHVSRAMLSRYSHVRMEAKRRALDEIAARQRESDEKRQQETERLQQGTVASQSASVQ